MDQAGASRDSRGQVAGVTGTVASINISGGGVPKRRVTGAKVFLLGLEGDDQDDKVHHGGPERAVCIFSLEKVRALQAEGHPIQPGSAGENLTVEGLAWETVMPRDPAPDRGQRVARDHVLYLPL